MTYLFYISSNNPCSFLPSSFLQKAIDSIYITREFPYLLIIYILRSNQPVVAREHAFSLNLSAHHAWNESKIRQWSPRSRHIALSFVFEHHFSKETPSNGESCARSPLDYFLDHFLEGAARVGDDLRKEKRLEGL